MNSSKLKNTCLVFRQCFGRCVQVKGIRSGNVGTLVKSVPNEDLSTNKDSKLNKTNKHVMKTHSIKKTNKDFGISNLLFSNKNDPEIFGSLSEDWKTSEQLKRMPDEEDDIVEREFLYNKEGKTRLTIAQYGKIIKKFLSEKKLALAIDVLETRMLKIDRAKPDNYIYNLLIGACGQFGYTNKAINLYTRMRKRELKVTGHTYTGLFNACANSPYPHSALERAKHLQGEMLEKGVLMNPKIYHVMIKAFGRCGDIETAFKLVDEMVDKKIRISNETFNFLLQACATDKTSGFRHALLVWRKMIQRRVRPNLYSFNLLLRCSRDCGLGDDVAMQQVIQLILHSKQSKTKGLVISEQSESQVSLAATADTLPNLISPEPTLGSVTAISSIRLPEHRLMLMGGSKGILAQMGSCQVKPDIKTFSQLLDQLSPCLEHEQELLDLVQEAGVSVDVDFCNMLIRKRCLRGDYDNAKKVLKIVHKEMLRPNIMTFGVLAMTCLSISEARHLLEDINNIGYRPNIEILDTLLRKACYSRNCDYVMEIVNTLEKEDVKPNELFLKHLDTFYNFITSYSSNNKSLDNSKTNKITEFCKFYKVWRQNIHLEAPPSHWQQFRQLHSDPEDIALMNTGRVQYSK